MWKMIFYFGGRSFYMYMKRKKIGQEISEQVRMCQNEALLSLYRSLNIVKIVRSGMPWWTRLEETRTAFGGIRSESGKWTKLGSDLVHWWASLFAALDRVVLLLSTEQASAAELYWGSTWFKSPSEHRPPSVSCIVCFSLRPFIQVPEQYF
jgi:hypothetical protein